MTRCRAEHCAIDTASGLPISCELPIGHEDTEHKWTHPDGLISIRWPDWGRVNARWRASEAARPATAVGAGS